MDRPAGAAAWVARGGAPLRGTWKWVRCSLGGADDSVNDRIAAWLSALAMLVDHPPVGVGVQEVLGVSAANQKGSLMLKAEVLLCHVWLVVAFAFGVHMSLTVLSRVAVGPIRGFRYVRG